MRARQGRDRMQKTEKDELRSEWKMATAILPTLSLTPKALIYVAIGWTALTLFFVWMPIVFAYAAVLLLWHLGRLFSGALVRAADILQGPLKNPAPPSEEGRNKNVSNSEAEL